MRDHSFDSTERHPALLPDAHAAPIGIIHHMTDRSPAKLIPSEAATAWTMGLVEPLLPDSVRMRIDDQFAQVARRHPSWAAAWFGGTISSIIRTLPATDPWRNLAGQIGNHVAAPEGAQADIGLRFELTQTDGAVNTIGPRQGQKFGSWHDGTDITPLVFEDPSRDVALVGISDPLHGHSAALIAFASLGWDSGITAARAVYSAAVPPADQPPTNVKFPDRWRSGVAGAHLYRIASDALRWSIWRRRSYGILDDPYIVETAFRWAHRSDRILLKENWDIDAVESEIAAEAITEPPESVAGPDAQGPSTRRAQRTDQTVTSDQLKPVEQDDFGSDDF